MQKSLERLLNKRKDRAIATILGVKEREIDFRIDAESARLLRKCILDQINGYHETVIEIVDSLDNGEVALNEVYLDRIDEIFDAVQALAARADGS